MMRRETHGTVIVIASVIVYIPVAGIINSFGVFVEKLNIEFCPFDCLQLLGWIGALTFGLNRAFCWLVMELQVIISPFLLFVLGVFMCTASLGLASVADRLGWLFLFYCLIYGFGSSLVMNTPYGLIEDIFPASHKHHVTATSIMNVGAPLGMLLVNPLVANLDTLADHTWRDTMRIFAGVVLITGLICSVPMLRWTRSESCASKDGYADIDQQSSEVQGDGDCKSTPSKEQSSLILLCGSQSPRNLLSWTSGMFLLSVAIFIPKVHFIQYMHDLRIEPEVAAACMSYEGLAEAILSFLIAVLGDPISPYFLWMYFLCSALLSVCSGILVLSTRVIHIAIYCTIHGAVDGLLMTTIYPTLPLLTTGVKAKQLLWSITLFVTGVGQVVGLPMAGLIYDETRSYHLVFYIASGVFGTAALAFLVICISGATYDIRSEDITAEVEEIAGHIGKNTVAIVQEGHPGYQSQGETMNLSTVNGTEHAETPTHGHENDRRSGAETTIR